MKARTGWLLCLLGLPLTVIAQDTNPTLLGAGIRSRPDYDGARKQTTDLIPVVRWYRGPLFARTTQGIAEAGARVDLARSLQAGVQLAYEAERWSGASVGAHLEWDTSVGPAPLNLLGRWRQHVDGDHGAQTDLRGTLGVYKSGPAAAGLFAQATWATRKAMLEAYGVDDGGLLFTSVGALGSYDLSRRWILLGSVEARRMSGDAARSPAVERRTNGYASAGLAFRFE